MSKTAYDRRQSKLPPRLAHLLVKHVRTTWSSVVIPVIHSVIYHPPVPVFNLRPHATPGLLVYHLHEPLGIVHVVLTLGFPFSSLCPLRIIHNDHPLPVFNLRPHAT